ncbi:DUF2336 domain-containing protein [Methylobacterium iners]|uniref:DUF2336 domain-containing protein n=1 Tax=Methylobacterium iners TaxID=418707 RepID=A0ABQ4RZH9_9HYPH|nr:DUF2336 domain-containing protein [Methylobacterium iners]GJD94962.1 hypothetical protein OCOJLMKI_2170 [Methylobacterium iners]
MAIALGSILEELEGAVARGGLDRRAALLRNLAGLFTDQAPRLRETHVAAFDAVLLHVARDAGGASRAELSERLADVANAPRRVVRDLAFDPTPAVAEPVLTRSLRLTEADLLALAGGQGQAHLLALSRRPVLAARVTDLLVVRGEAPVLRSVAGNAGARLSRDGYEILGNRAAGDALLVTRLQVRPDTPAELRSRLSALAQIAGEAPQAGSGIVSGERLLAAEVFVSTQARKGALDENRVVSWLNSGRETEALVALARLAGVPSAMAIAAYHAETYDALLRLVRSVRFGWRILTIFLATRAGGEPPAEIMQAMMAAFQGLPVTEAQQALRRAAA